jgi:hypothetical protein
MKYTTPECLETAEQLRLEWNSIFSRMNRKSIDINRQRGHGGQTINRLRGEGFTVNIKPGSALKLNNFNYLA